MPAWSNRGPAKTWRRPPPVASVLHLPSRRAYAYAMASGGVSGAAEVK
jgi:hypothetical protein